MAGTDARRNKIEFSRLRLAPRSPDGIFRHGVRRVPLALKSLTVSVVLPSALSTVTSVRVTSKVPPPVASTCIVTDSPSALVVVTVWSSSVPFWLKSLTVSVRLPLQDEPLARAPYDRPKRR